MTALNDEGVRRFVFYVPPEATSSNLPATGIEFGMRRSDFHVNIFSTNGQLYVIQSPSSFTYTAVRVIPPANAEVCLRPGWTPHVESLEIVNADDVFKDFERELNSLRRVLWPAAVNRGVNASLLIRGSDLLRIVERSVCPAPPELAYRLCQCFRFMVQVYPHLTLTEHNDA